MVGLGPGTARRQGFQSPRSPWTPGLGGTFTGFLTFGVPSSVCGVQANGGEGFCFVSNPKVWMETGGEAYSGALVRAFETLLSRGSLRPGAERGSW